MVVVVYSEFSYGYINETVNIKNKGIIRVLQEIYERRVGKSLNFKYYKIEQ